MRGIVILGCGLALSLPVYGQGVGFPSAAPPSGSSGWNAPPPTNSVPGAATAPLYTPPPASGSPSTYGTPPAYSGSPPSTYGAVPNTYSAPPTYGAPAYGTVPPAATLAPGIQPFDPYALPSGTPALPPPLGSPTGAPAGVLPPTPYTPNPTSSVPYGGNPNAWGAQPGTPYFPDGIWPTQASLPYQRLFQDTGLAYTWLYGSGDGNSLMINEFDISTTAVFPNFLGGTGPLRVRPGFTLDLLDGPKPPEELDLPPTLYSAYLDFGWKPWFTPQLGGEFAVTPGVFSDFSTFTNSSFRVMASAAGVVRLTPSCSLKLGAQYIDRNDIKLLPIAGIVWDPSPQKHWEIVIPNPKLACYGTTRGNTQVWWYIGGEYGGGAWTYERLDDPNAGTSDRIDINDLRVYVGVDWFNLNRWHSYAELGYVFNRQIVDVAVPEESVDLEDTVMIRAGISW